MIGWVAVRDIVRFGATVPLSTSHGAHPHPRASILTTIRWRLLLHTQQYRANPNHYCVARSSTQCPRTRCRHGWPSPPQQLLFPARFVPHHRCGRLGLGDVLPRTSVLYGAGGDVSAGLLGVVRASRRRVRRWWLTVVDATVL